MTRRHPSCPATVDHETETVAAQIVPLGDVDEVTCAILVAHLHTIMGLPARTLPPMDLPQAAWMPARAQYDAAVVLEHLRKDKDPKALCLGVTRADLCLPIFTHVFGEALVGGSVAVVSDHRLQQTTSPDGHAQARTYERMVRVACHEVGHALGMTHCQRPACLMHFAGSVEAIDTIQLGFCFECHAELQELIARLRLRGSPLSDRLPSKEL